MEYISKKSTKLFAGRVIDGPLEGEWIESDDAHFYGYLNPTVFVTPNQPMECDHLMLTVYVWLNGYRAWAWMQPRK